MRRQTKIKTTPLKVTLTEPEELCLNNLRRAGCFRSNSETIGEVLRFVQKLRDNPTLLTLKLLGERFGIDIKD